MLSDEGPYAQLEKKMHVKIIALLNIRILQFYEHS